MLLCRSVALHACERMHGNRKGHAATTDMWPPRSAGSPLEAEGTVTAPPRRGTRHSCPHQSHCFLPYPGPLLPRWLPGRYILPKPPTTGPVPAEGMQGAAGGIHAASWP